MAYTPPAYNEIDHEITSGYTPPVNNAVNFSTGESYLPLEKELVQGYSIAGALEATSIQVYGIKLGKTLTQPYESAPILQSKLNQYYGDAVQLKGPLVQQYGDAFVVQRELIQPWHVLASLQKILEQRYSMTGTKLQVALEQLYNLNDFTVISRSLVQPFLLMDGGTQLLTPDPGDGAVVIPPDGTPGGGVAAGTGLALNITHINIEATRDQYCLSCELHLASQADYVQLQVMDDLTITVGGKDFYFFIESKRRNRGHGRAEYLVKGLSKTALLDAPYAEPITDELSGLASAIVAGLAVGYTVTWNTVDWYIPPATLMPADQTPLAIIHTIAHAAGAILQTEPDGSLTIEPAYPVAVNRWPTAPIDHTLSDALDFFTTGEDYDHRPGYNRYLISDQLTSGYMRRQEPEALTSATKYIRDYRVPWDDYFSLRHTGGDWVRLEPLGIEERLIEDEIVEFVNGTGNTSYPIYERVAVEWLQTNLGTVTFGEDGALESSVAGESMLKISYRTKCRKYLATDHEDEQVQLVAEGVD